MNLKNFLKLIDDKIKNNYYIKVRTWDLYNGFRNWNIDDKEIQKAKVMNLSYSNNEFWIDAKIL